MSIPYIRRTREGHTVLTRISHGPVRNAHGVPIRHWRIGGPRKAFGARPGKQLAKPASLTRLRRVSMQANWALTRKTGWKKLHRRRPASGSITNNGVEILVI